METVKGYVEHIVYRNKENGYTVLELTTDSETYTLVGILPHVSEGEPLEAEGTDVYKRQDLIYEIAKTVINGFQK